MQLREQSVEMAKKHRIDKEEEQRTKYKFPKYICVWCKVLTRPCIQQFHIE